MTIREIEEIFRMLGLASDKERQHFLKMAGLFEARTSESEKVFIRAKSDTKEEGGAENA